MKIALVHPNETLGPPKVIPLLTFNINMHKLALKKHILLVF